MATSSPVVDDAASTIRRASGRVRKQPELFSSPVSNGKRKRNNEANDEDEPDDDVGSEEQASSEDGEPDEEEIRERARKSRKTKTTVPKKPAQKKSKTNGTTLPVRPAKKRAPKRGKAVNTQDAEDAGGLYADAFAGDDTLEAVAADWLKSFNDHESQALADVVTFVLKCAGCDSVVTARDIEDPDDCTNRLSDLQDEFQGTAPTEYPLIAKGKAGAAFKETMTGFLDALLKSMAASGRLYTETNIIDNMEVWLSTMSSAGNRAFRHTATVASLSVITALAEISAERGKAAADWQRQANADRSKKNANKARLRDLDTRARDATQAQEFIETQLKDWFDTVFIHRYRDVDPVIRRDCAIALTDWIMALPEYFFDGQHLRYLGWVLSDTVAATRLEVVKQLRRLYKDKDKIAGLKTFTERFRSRMVEIATADAESNVRAAGIELLDELRGNGLLEPDDIDAVGRLIYDSEVRVRKAVAPFFAENVKDLYGSKIDDLGGIENLEESLPEVDEDNFDTPRLQWLMFKSLAEMMAAYDVEDDAPSYAERSRDGTLILHAINTESRFTLAADALYEKVDKIKDWRSLSGYILFDHSAGRTNGVANDSLSQLKHQSVLNEHEEVVLLEILSTSVKHAVIDMAEEKSSTKKKLTKKQKEELSEEQEDAARHLATLIPKLLKKYGDGSKSAAAVLRLESVLNLPSMRDLRQDSAAYGALLDDIRKQFMAHGTDEVLGPASEAILHAKSYGELDDVTEEKLGVLWEDVVNNLAELIRPDTITVRGVSDREQLVAVSNNLLRITRLAQVSNCTVALEDGSVAQANSATGADYQGVIDYIIALVHRAVPSSEPLLASEDAALEDEVAARAAEAALRYLQWKIHLIMQSNTTASAPEMAYDELEALASRRDTYVNNLDAVLQSRKGGEAISVSVAQRMLELYTSAVMMKSIKPRPGVSDDWEVLIMNLEPSYVKTILQVFSASEKSYANLSNKKLELPTAVERDADVDADPVDDDPMSDSAEEEEEEEEEEEDEDEATQPQSQRSQQRKENKIRKIVLAEKTLCELTGKMIFAIHAGVDDGSMRKRLERNRSKLGPNYKELLVYMDVGQVAKNARSKAKAKAKAHVNGVGSKVKAHSKSNAIVAEDEVDDEIEDVDEVVAGEEESVVGE